MLGKIAMGFVQDSFGTAVESGQLEKVKKLVLKGAFGVKAVLDRY